MYSLWSWMCACRYSSVCSSAWHWTSRRAMHLLHWCQSECSSKAAAAAMGLRFHMPMPSLFGRAISFLATHCLLIKPPELYTNLYMAHVYVLVLYLTVYGCWLGNLDPVHSAVVVRVQCTIFWQSFNPSLLPEEVTCCQHVIRSLLVLFAQFWHICYVMIVA